MDHLSKPDATFSKALDGRLEMEPQAEIDGLPEALGFSETVELREIRDQLIEAMAAGAETVPALAARYQELAEAVVEQHLGSDFARAQIGLMVQMALIRRDAGRVEHHREDLEDALTYAAQMGFADIATTLEGVLAEPEQGAEVASEPTNEQLAEACGEVLSSEERAELATMPLDEALGYVFTLLAEKGVEDPEDFLRAKGILE